jgi:hypothetical protein
MTRGGRETKDKKKGDNNCRWSRMMKGKKEIKNKKKGVLTIVDEVE